MKALLFAIFASTLVLATTIRATPDSGSAASSIAWKDCDDGLQCATVRAPLDHAQPSGPKIDVAIARLPAADPSTRIGSLLINPGGPGASGVDFLRAIVEDPPKAWHDNFDIVGFDPRGTSDTIPVDCTDKPTSFTDLDPSPDTAAERTALYDAAKKFGADCKLKNNDILPFIDTISAAKDIDVIRAALDEETITYFGYSYGTQLGATYAGRFPERVRAFVLDGALDPSLSADDLVIEQAKGFESALNAFLADCASKPACAFKATSGDLGATLDELLVSIDRKALPVVGDTRTVTEGIATVGVASALYDKEFGWPLLADALAAAQAGDGAGLLQLADFYNDRLEDGSYSNLIETYFAITCLDQPFPTGVAGYEALLTKIVAAAPRAGAGVAVGTNLPCAFWPVPAKGHPAPISASGAAPIVVVGTTNDPATPYTWAQSLADQLESGVLLTRVGEGHTAYQQGSSCIDDALDKYIVTLDPPLHNTVCQQDDDVAPTPTDAPPAPVITPTAPAGTIAPPNTGSGPGSGGSAPLIIAMMVAAAAGSTLVIVGRRMRRGSASVHLRHTSARRERTHRQVESGVRSSPR